MSTKDLKDDGSGDRTIHSDGMQFRKPYQADFGSLVESSALVEPLGRVLVRFTCLDCRSMVELVLDVEAARIWPQPARCASCGSNYALARAEDGSLEARYTSARSDKP